MKSKILIPMMLAALTIAAPVQAKQEFADYFLCKKRIPSPQLIELVKQNARSSRPAGGAHPKTSRIYILNEPIKIGKIQTDMVHIDGNVVNLYFKEKPDVVRKALPYKFQREVFDNFWATSPIGVTVALEGISGFGVKGQNTTVYCVTNGE